MPEKSRDAFCAENAKLKPDQKIALGELLRLNPQQVDLKKLLKVFGKREQLLSYLKTCHAYHDNRDPERAARFAELLKRVTTSNN